MESFKKIIIVRAKKPTDNNLNAELQWLSISLGLFNLRDKERSMFRLFVELLKAAKRNEQLQSDELAYRLHLTRGTIVHHLNKLIDSGLVVTSHNKYMLRVRSLERLVKEIHADVDEFLKEVEDAGNTEFDKDDDYTKFAIKTAEAVGKEGREIGQEKIRGVLMCRSAAGMVIAANKVKGVRAVSAFDETSAMHSREHNDANVLALSGDWLDLQTAKGILKTWLETKYSGEERHTRRLKEILKLEK